MDDRDIPALALMTETVHKHGALAAIELVHAGMNAANLYSREVSIAPSHVANPGSYAPAQARAMTKRDIRSYRQWHRDAALRARRAGFDIIYVYAGHGCPWQCIFTKSAQWPDGRIRRQPCKPARLLRELIEDTKEAVGTDCAVAVR